MDGRERLVIYPNGEVHTVGIHYAGKRLVVKETHDGIIAIKEMSGKAWTNRMCPWHSTPATLHVYRIVEDKKRRKTVDVREPHRGDGARREVTVERVLEIELRDIAKTKPEKRG